MESMLPLAILFAILTVLLLGAVIFLCLLFVKTQMSQLRFLIEQQTRSETQRTEEMGALRDLVSETLETTSSHASASLERSLQTVGSVTTSQQQALAKMVEATQYGASSSVTELAKLVRETTTLLGTKDPIAYQVAMGAQQMVTPGSEQHAYTSTDAMAAEDAERLERLRASADVALANMFSFVNPGGQSGDESEYFVPSE